MVDDRDQMQDQNREAALEAHFAAARAEMPQMRPGLVEAIVADADRVRPRAAAGARLRAAAVRTWAAAGGLAAAAVFGFAIGATGFLGLDDAPFQFGGTSAESPGDNVADFFELAATGE